MILGLDMDMSRGAVHKDTTTTDRVGLGATLGAITSALHARDKMINAYLVTREELVLAKSIHSFLYSYLLHTRNGTGNLLTKHASCTLRRMSYLSSRRMKSTLGRAQTKYSGSHQELDPGEAKMPKALMPLQEFLFRS